MIESLQHFLDLFQLATFTDFQNRPVHEITENGIIVMPLSTGKFINPQKARRGELCGLIHAFAFFSQVFFYHSLKAFLNEARSDLSLFGYLCNGLLTCLFRYIFPKSLRGPLIFSTDTVWFGERSSAREAAKTAF